MARISIISRLRAEDGHLALAILRTGAIAN